ncbi:hypothetical protein [Burkholderia pyrrocinia]|uniref:hypothetical protein n=1 Tax=Burkholderia pyrrocinia TaxID=60550 RepID=UPI001BD00476|nr:hypothetical protein [Burkholderia pyrrocinia]QVN21768.1 hypothetical protein JYG32_20510 [Burkholderia pyrrocinia]
MIDQQKDPLRRRVLGWGVACDLVEATADIGRDIRFVTTNSLLDLARVELIDNLGQSLSIALTTALGSDLFNVGYGFDGINAIAEETNPVLMRERIRIAIIKVLRADPRIRRIVDVKLEDGRLDAVTAGSSILDVRVAFETLSGDAYSINIDQIALGAGQVTTNG